MVENKIRVTENGIMVKKKTRLSRGKKTECGYERKRDMSDRKWNVDMKRKRDILDRKRNIDMKENGYQGKKNGM